MNFQGFLEFQKQHSPDKNYQIDETLGRSKWYFYYNLNNDDNSLFFSKVLEKNFPIFAQDAKRRLRTFRTPQNTIKRSLQSVLNRPFSMDGKSRERHVMLRYRSILVTRGSRHGDGTRTERRLYGHRNGTKTLTVL